MKPRLLAVAVVASSIAVVAACGGAKSNELFADPSTSEFGTEPTNPPAGASSSASSGGGSSGLSGSGSTSSGGSTTSSSGGSTTSSSGGSSGAPTKDAGTKPGPTSKGIWCGEDQDGDDTYCAAGSSCCAKDSGAGGPSLECNASGFGGCQGGLSIKCDDHTDCPTGQVCCGTFEENFGYKQIQCSPTCTTVTGAVRSVRFCDQDAAKDECAAIGKVCGWSQSLPGYSVCK